MTRYLLLLLVTGCSGAPFEAAQDDPQDLAAAAPEGDAGPAAAGGSAGAPSASGTGGHALETSSAGGAAAVLPPEQDSGSAPPAPAAGCRMYPDGAVVADGHACSCGISPGGLLEVPCCVAADGPCGCRLLTSNQCEAAQ